MNSKVLLNYLKPYKGVKHLIKKNQNVEDIIKAMAMKSGGKDKMGPKQYAIATAQAKKSAE
jgi:hypothetical protein